MGQLIIFAADSQIKIDDSNIICESAAKFTSQ